MWTAIRALGVLVVEDYHTLAQSVTKAHALLSFVWQACKTHLYLFDLSSDKLKAGFTGVWTAAMLLPGSTLSFAKQV